MKVDTLDKPVEVKKPVRKERKTSEAEQNPSDLHRASIPDQWRHTGGYFDTSRVS